MHKCTIAIDDWSTKKFSVINICLCHTTDKNSAIAIQYFMTGINYGIYALEMQQSCISDEISNIPYKSNQTRSIK